MIKALLQFFYRRQRLLLVIMIAATATILLATLLPTDKIAQSSFLEYDKIIHALVFGGWTYLFGLVRISYTHQKPGYLGIELLTGFAFGLSIEILQHVLPVNRSGDLFDLLADLVGVVIAVYFIRETYNQLDEDMS